MTNKNQVSFVTDFQAAASKYKRAIKKDIQ